MKHILVPSDFTDLANEALHFATDLAVRTKGTITVLHAINIPALYDFAAGGGGMYAYGPAIVEDLEEIAKSEFRRLTSAYEGTGVAFDLEIAFEELVSGIRHLAERKTFDLIVMGTAGAHGPGHFLIGTNTERVVRSAGIPVMTVRKAVRPETIKKLLVPVDIREEHPTFMTRVKALQEFFDASVDLLLVNTPARFIKDADAFPALEKLIEKYGLERATPLFRSYVTEEEGILDVAVTQHADLIAMATHSRKGLAHLFTGSITEDVVSRVACPIWTYSVRQGK